MLDELTRRRHEHEQAAYNELRASLVEDFLSDPIAFVAMHGKRPEDLTGHELREFYPTFLAQGRQPTGLGNGMLAKKFKEGRLLGCGD
jgi:hypothetical protein